MGHSLLDFYKAIEQASEQMLLAARHSDWERLAQCESNCVLLINELRVHSKDAALTAAQHKEKTRIMQSILRNDAQIRILAEPWLATLEHMGKVPASSALH